MHGAPLGAEGVAKTKEALGYPVEPAFYVSDNVAAYFRAAGERGAEKERRGNELFRAYADAYPELAAALRLALDNKLPDGWDSELPAWEPGTSRSRPAKPPARSSTPSRQGAELHRRLGRSQSLDEHRHERRRRF